MNVESAGIDPFAVGIDVGVEIAAGRKAIFQLDGTDLDDPVAVFGAQPGRLGIENDLAKGHFMDPQIMIAS